MASLTRLIRYPTALGRIIIIIMNNIYCIPTYVIWMIILTPLKCINSKAYYKIEGLFFHWLLAIVALWSYTAGYDIVETGDDISECRDKRTLVIVNHQSTADVPLLMANFNTKRGVLPNIMWIMDRLFKYTNFGIVSMIHQDFFITSGKQHRDSSIRALREHIQYTYFESTKKWIVLFPEGGFLRKRKEVSRNFALKNNLPLLEYVTIPRVGAFQAIFETLRSKDSNYSQNTVQSNNVSLNKNIEQALLDYVLDITVAYPDQNPLDLSNIVHGLRRPCTTYMFYRLYKAESVPREENAMKQWLYDRFIEKNGLLENFYKLGTFIPNEPLHEHLIQQDVLRFVLINVFFIISTYFHMKLIYKFYAQCVYYVHQVTS